MKTYISQKLITSSEFKKLLDIALVRCDKLELSSDYESKYQIPDKLGEMLISSKKEDQKTIYIYKYDKVTSEIIYDFTNNIYFWRSPNLQSDFILLRNNGSEFLSFCGDMEIFIDLDNGEKNLVDKVLPKLFKEYTPSKNNKKDNSDRVILKDRIRSKKFDYLPNDFIALVKNYLEAIEEAWSAISNQEIVDDVNDIPNLGFKKELEIRGDVIKSSLREDGAVEEIDLVQSEEKRIEAEFSKYIISNPKNSKKYFSSIADAFLGFYPSIISVSTAPNEQYWSSYLVYFQDIRNDINEIIKIAEFLEDSVLGKKLSTIKEFDEELISNLQDKHFNSSHYKAEIYPKSCWWYHLNNPSILKNYGRIDNGIIDRKVLIKLLEKMSKGDMTLDDLEKFTSNVIVGDEIDVDTDEQELVMEVIYYLDNLDGVMFEYSPNKIDQLLIILKETMDQEVAIKQIEKLKQPKNNR